MKSPPMLKHDPANIKRLESSKLEHYANACPTKEMYEEQQEDVERKHSKLRTMQVMSPTVLRQQ